VSGVRVPEPLITKKAGETSPAFFYRVLGTLNRDFGGEKPHRFEKADWCEFSKALIEINLSQWKSIFRPKLTN
jgi:hypothetical protein